MKEKDSKKEKTNTKPIKKPTLWLDLLTYVLIPLVTLLGLIRVVRTVFVGNFTTETTIFLLVELAFIILFLYTLYHVHNRNKPGFFLIRFIVYITAVRASVDFAFFETANKDSSFLFAMGTYLVISALVWIMPNELYFRAREQLFKNESTLAQLFKKEKAKDEK